MFTRTTKQKVLVSLQNPRRVLPFLKDPNHRPFSKEYAVKEGHLVVKETSRAGDYKRTLLYGDADILGHGQLEDFWSWLQEARNDYDTNFKKATGKTLSELEKQYLQ